MGEQGFLFLGFAVVWVAMAAYLFSLGRRQQAIRLEVERLERETREGQGA